MECKNVLSYYPGNGNSKFSRKKFWSDGNEKFRRTDFVVTVT